MSHIVTIETQVRDPAAVEAACRRLGLALPQHGEHRLYASKAAGLGVQLPGWRYPLACDIAAGKPAHDNFGGRWGEQAQLDRFLQAYAVEKATKIEARRKGHSVVEQPPADGSIKLIVQVAGGAA